MRQLVPVIKTYEWGSKSIDNHVARLGKSKDSNLPFAEAWLGTHPSGTSKELKTGKEIEGKLSFLLKVLEIEKCLSLQIHPNEAQADALRKADPEHYPDSFPKPELVVALSEMKAFFGFTTFKEFEERLGHLPSFGPLLLGSLPKEFNQMETDSKKIKAVCEFISFAEQEVISKLLLVLENDLSLDSSFDRSENLKILASQFPGDRGIILTLLLNLITLNKGEALAVAANVPHAYFSGSAVECMAASDNVIRLGLTPKFRDVKSFLELADFEPHKVEKATKKVLKSEGGLSLCSFEAGFDKYFVLSVIEGEGVGRIDVIPHGTCLGFNIGGSVDVLGEKLEKDSCFGLFEKVTFTNELKENTLIFIAGNIQA